MRYDGQKHVFHEKELFSPTLCAVVFDGPVGEQAPPEDGSVELGKLGELEESRLLQKLQEMIRADPEKAENLYEKFREILKAEKREDLICCHCPLLNHQNEWEGEQMIKSGFLASGSLKERHIRGVRMRKVAKKKEKNQNRNQIGRNSKAATLKRLQNGKRKEKIERRSKKSKERNSSKKKQKSKKSKSKKGRKGKKTNKLKKDRRERERQGDANVIKACLTKVIFYARLNEKKATAISKQVKRIKDNDDIQIKKGQKKTEFNPIKDRLLSALGGDVASPSCGGQPLNTATLETLTTLMACEVDIEEKCGNRITGNASKLAELEACETFADDFKTAFSRCFNVSIGVEESCTCVEEISESEVASMLQCEVKDDNNVALKAKKSCKAAFGKCKNAAVAAVEGIDTCKEEKNSQAAVATTASTTGQIAPCLVVSILLFPMIKVVS